MRYHLCKQTRGYNGQPYCGPTSNGILAGSDDLDEALKMAKKFNIENTVGWNVYDSITGLLVEGFDLFSGENPMQITYTCQCKENSITFELKEDEILSTLAKWFVIEKLEENGWDVTLFHAICPDCKLNLEEDRKFSEKYAEEIRETDESDYKREVHDFAEKYRRW